MTRNPAIDSRLAVLIMQFCLVTCNDCVLFKYFKWLYSYLASRKQSQLGKESLEHLFEH